SLVYRLQAANPEQPLVDYLRYKSLTEDEVTISLFGSSATAGVGASEPKYAWGGHLEAQLHALGKDFQKVQVVAHGFPTYSTTRLVKEVKIKSVLADKPDLVIVETGLFHNYDQHVPLDETKQKIDAIVHSLQKNVPEAKIIVTSSNPVSIVSEENTENYIDYTYNDYIESLTGLAKEKGWAYVNIHDEMEARLAQENIQLSSLLTKGTDLIDDGHAIWAEELVEYLSKK
uniref:SGNH/GDSL hydrolase family protein n=1 Tax=Domibacillus robiginosus TaxID=1071054 RepID=UPI00067E074D